MSWVPTISKSLKELRFIFCQTSERSNGLRNYVYKNYWDLKNQNTEFPFIVRECEEADPYIIARYQYGVEQKAFTSNVSEKEIEAILQDLVDQSKTVNNLIQQ